MAGFVKRAQQSDMNKEVKQIKKIVDEKVIGKITPEHTDDAHFYRFPTGELLPSVTTKTKIINKPHLLRWSIKKAIEWLEVEDRFANLSVIDYRNDMIDGAFSAHVKVRDDAGDVGTQAHNAIELYIKDWIKNDKRPGDIKEFFPNTYSVATNSFVRGIDPRAVASARALEKLMIDKDVYPLYSEILVGHPKYSAGTLDFLCMWNGKLTLADFKTSNSVSDDYALQTVAYKFFFEYMTWLKIEQIKIIHLSKDSDKYTLYKVNRMASALKAFKGVVSLYDWMYNGREKLSKDVKRIVI